MSLHAASRRLLALLLCLLPAVALAASRGAAGDDLAPIPALSARVTDAAGMLSAAQREELERLLAATEAKTGNQVAVLIVPTTRPETIEQYGIRVAEQWKVGRAGVDNGVILIVAKNDLTLRIEVGHGAEGQLPDVVARRIIDEEVVPRFRAGDYAGGVRAGLERIEQALATGAPVTAPGARVGPAEPQRRGAVPLFDLLVFGLILVPMLGGVLRAMFGRFLGSLAGGGIAGAVVWLVTGSLLIAAIALVVGLIAIAATGSVGGLGRYPPRGGRGGWGGSGWGGGGWGGGGWGGGGGSGGWSGGGGTFGGGGASGSWR